MDQFFDPLEKTLLIHLALFLEYKICRIENGREIISSGLPSNAKKYAMDWLDMYYGNSNQTLNDILYKLNVIEKEHPQEMTY